MTRDVIEDFWVHFHEAVASTNRRIAAERAAMVREVAATYLPRWLHWTLRRPRVLRQVYRVRPGWRPTLYIGYDPGGPRGGGAITEWMRRADGALVLVHRRVCT